MTDTSLISFGYIFTMLDVQIDAESLELWKYFVGLMIFYQPVSQLAGGQE